MPRIQSDWAAAEQDRINKNLQAVRIVKLDTPRADQNGAAVDQFLKRFLDKLADLEGELEQEHTAQNKRKQEATRANMELSEFLERLIVE